jgi:hypothetical protein
MKVRNWVVIEHRRGFGVFVWPHGAHRWMQI